MRLLQLNTDRKREHPVSDEAFSMLSHELRTPLAAILGYADLLQEELDGPHQELVRYIRENGHRLQRVLSSLLELQEAAQSRGREETEFDVTATIRAVMDTAHHEASERGLQLVLDGNEEPVRALTHAFGLESAFRHVLDNAVKFTQSGEIVVSVESSDENIRIEITDTGCGFGDQPETLKEAFRQGSTGLSRTHDGLGLGLHLADKAMKGLGGSLRCENREEGGARAILEFPKRLRPVLRRAA